MARTSAPRVSSPLARIPPLSIGAAQPPKTYSLRCDFLWNEEDEEIVVEYEMPGVKISDVDISLARDPYSQAAQVIVQGRSEPRLTEAAGKRMHLRRERAYGNFRRVFNVPPTTTVRRHLCAILCLSVRCDPTTRRSTMYLLSYKTVS